MPHPAGVDPGAADMAGAERVEHQSPRLDILAAAGDLLLLGVVDLEDHVAVVEGHPPRQATRLDHAGHRRDPAEILGPHVDVDLEARLDAAPLALPPPTAVEVTHHHGHAT